MDDRVCSRPVRRNGLKKIDGTFRKYGILQGENLGQILPVTRPPEWVVNLVPSQVLTAFGVTREEFQKLQFYTVHGGNHRNVTLRDWISKGLLTPNFIVNYAVMDHYASPLLQLRGSAGANLSSDIRV